MTLCVILTVSSTTHNEGIVASAAAADWGVTTTNVVEATSAIETRTCLLMTQALAVETPTLSIVTSNYQH